MSTAFHCLWMGLVSIGLLLSIGTDAQVTAAKPKSEIVMSPGMQITAKTPIGTITITARENYLRSYTWARATRSAYLEPRPERWYGSLGIYYLGADGQWDVHDGINRCSVEEGQQHFKTIREALNWIHNGDLLYFVYRDDGLVVGWDKDVNPGELEVEVWQILIQDKKPHGLPGSQNDKVQVSHVQTETSPLVQAVQKNDLPQTRLLLAKGFDPNVKSSVGYPVLVIAARFGFEQIVDVLLEKGANPNARDVEGSTALLEAAADGYTSIVKALLAKRADVNQTGQKGVEKGTTASMGALMMRHIDILRLLLDQGAEVNIKSAYGLTCLAIEQIQNHPDPDIIQLLKKAGAKE